MGTYMASNIMDRLFSPAGTHLDNLAIWGGWLAKQTTTFDSLALGLAVLLAILYHSRKYYYPDAVDIPSEFWYKVPQSQTGQTLLRGKKAEARNITTLFADQNLDTVVFWGSQSGRAEALARRLARSLQDRYGLSAVAVDLDDYDHVHLPELTERHLCGFVLSTYGDGDPPDNTNGLWNTLISLQARGANLGGMRYILFGLGNSNYRLYNSVADSVDAALRRLQAQRYGAVGYGDDANGETEEGFLSWRRQIEEELKTRLGLSEQEQSYRPAFEVEVEHGLSIPLDRLHLGEPAAMNRARLLQGQLADTKPAIPIPVSGVRRLWETDDRLCLHIDLDLGKQRLVKYKTGDHMAIWPCNPNHEVERTLAALGLEPRRHSPLTIRPSDKININTRVPVPTPTTLDALFRHYLEICGALSLEAVAALAEFAPSEAARAELRRLSGDVLVFRSEVVAAHMTLADLLEAVAPGAAWEIPLSFLLERLKPMQPRYYSISSSPAVEPRKISLTAVVTKTPLRGQTAPGHDHDSTLRGCYGLATSYLHALERSLRSSSRSSNTPTPASSMPLPLPSFALGGPRGALQGGKLYGRVRQSAFKMPPKPSSPIIMVGAGTGVAPFRAFVQERAQRHEISPGDVGRTMLFMGFRRRNVDFIYESEWERWRDAMGRDVFDFWAAFSRDDDNVEKVYVQDVMTRKASEIREVLENSYTGRLFICGSAQMARDVKTALTRMRSRWAGESEEEAVAWVQQLRQANRLLEDVWS